MLLVHIPLIAIKTTCITTVRSYQLLLRMKQRNSQLEETQFIMDRLFENTLHHVLAKVAIEHFYDISY